MRLRIVISAFFLAGLTFFLLRFQSPPESEKVAETTIASEKVSLNKHDDEKPSSSNPPDGNRNDVEEAVDNLNRILEKNPNDEKAIMDLAQIYKRTYEFKSEAEELLRRAKELDPENDRALQDYLDLYSAHDDAFQELENLARKNRYSPTLSVAYARLLSEREKYEEAKEALRWVPENLKNQEIRKFQNELETKLQGSQPRT